MKLVPAQKDSRRKIMNLNESNDLWRIALDEVVCESCVGLSLVVTQVLMCQFTTACWFKSISSL